MEIYMFMIFEHDDQSKYSHLKILLYVLSAEIVLDCSDGDFMGAKGNLCFCLLINLKHRLDTPILFGMFDGMKQKSKIV